MPRSVVVDASPLIFLASAGLLDLLRRPDWEVTVPSAVRSEILRRGAEDVTVKALAGATWVGAAELVDVPRVILDRDLGPGESETLAHGVARPGALLVMDDLGARRLAAQLGLTVVGTLGVVLAAKATGRIPSARAVLDQLRGNGMYLADRVLDRALREVGE
jgi:uncharacterized protein